MNLCGPLNINFQDFLHSPKTENCKKFLFCHEIEIAKNIFYFPKTEIVDHIPKKKLYSFKTEILAYSTKNSGFYNVPLKPKSPEVSLYSSKTEISKKKI